MAVYLRPDDMTEFLADRIGPHATYADGQRLFDFLVLRGLLRPWIKEFWELDTIEDSDWSELVQVSAKDSRHH